MKQEIQDSEEPETLCGNRTGHLPLPEQVVRVLVLGIGLAYAYILLN